MEPTAALATYEVHQSHVGIVLLELNPLQARGLEGVTNQFLSRADTMRLSR
jgi:hypothetical protein